MNATSQYRTAVIDVGQEYARITVMNIFKRKKNKPEPQPAGPPCSHCGSTNTVLKVYHGSDQPDYVRVWRGQRAFTYRCANCGMEFYGDATQDEIANDDSIVYDAEALRAAEDELKREIEEDNDRRCR
jgi:hypothetical protein